MTSSTETTDRPSESVAGRESTDDPRRKPVDTVNSPPSTAVTTLAAQSVSQSDFLRRLATELASSFSVPSVAVMHASWDAPMVLATESALTDQLAGQLDGQMIADLLNASTTAPSACDIPLQGDSGPNRTRGLHVRLLDEEGSCAVLLVYGAAESPDALGQIRDLGRLADYAKHCRTALRALAANPTFDPTGRGLSTTEHERTLRHFHHDLDLTGTAYRIANESRRLLEVDRVTVLLADRGKLRVESISGVAVVDRRANSVAAAEEFARRVIVLGRPIVLPSKDPLPPQIADPLDSYLDESDVTAVTVMPLYRPIDSKTEKSNPVDTGRLSAVTYTEDQTNDAEPIAVMLFESFSNRHSEVMTPALREVGAEAAIALSNALEHRRIFGLRLLKTLGDWFGGRRLPYTAIGLVAATALLAASMIIEVDHKVIATGFAEPAFQQNVFARTDGVVKAIFVRDGQRVETGETLLQLENADLETSAETLAGEIQTTSLRLSSIGSMLLDPATDAKQAGHMAIEQRQLQSELASLRSQLDLVRDQISELEIKAPIDGIVAGWQLHRKLSDRPVSRGNHLLTIARENGPWQLRLEIPDKDASEIIDASRVQDALEVNFAAASHPESTFAATLTSIATAARRNESGTNVVDAMANIAFDRDTTRRLGLQQFSVDDARIGVEATAKISCGRRVVLSSWFGDVADFFHRNVLFYFR